MIYIVSIIASIIALWFEHILVIIIRLMSGVNNSLVHVDSEHPHEGQKVLKVRKFQRSEQ